MKQDIDYYEIEKTDRICPLLSVAEVRQFGRLLYCVGEKCMWWQSICKSIEEQYETGCSKCGEILTYETDYCPNCGAKMERSKDVY